ncbi:MAG: hypothetical protein ACKV2V_19720 [Blastocatellia bacterium]
MSDTTTTTSCLDACASDAGLLPLSPFEAPRYHFGMLLGREDFETEQGYHRAKMQLHNAWLHRAGAVWGLDVRLDTARGEIRVTPGLALDAAGHELHLDTDACVNVGAWYDKYKNKYKLPEPERDRVPLNAHVVIRFHACATRQVPALLEPCNNAGSGTAYSRIHETVTIELLPGLAPPRIDPYHRLRLLFSLAAPRKQGVDGASAADQQQDQQVSSERTRIAGLAAADQPMAWLAAFRRFAALDEIELPPGVSVDGARTLLFPGRDDDALVLANLQGLILTRGNNGWALSAPADAVDVTVRPAHVATSTIQELLCGGLACCGDTAPPPPETAGPRAVSLQLDDNRAVLTFDQPLHASSVKPAAFSVTVFTPAGGWGEHTVQDVFYDATTDPARPTALLKTDPALPTPPAGLLRVIARGTGPMPLLGVNNLPLAGGITDPPAPGGLDYVWMGDLASDRVWPAEPRQPGAGRRRGRRREPDPA